MSDTTGFDFTKFVPGFDFLKNMASGGSAPAASTGWVAPTLDPEELDKRIQELKTVHFWLDQNTKAVGATIQALEVQRMTLATLKGMNMSFSELAESLKVKPEAAAPAPTPEASTPQPEPESEAAPKKQRSGKAKSSSQAVDPAQWWGALTQQFQHIANNAMQEMAKNAGNPADTSAASEPAKPAKATAKKTAAAKKTRSTATKRRTTERKKP